VPVEARENAQPTKNSAHKLVRNRDAMPFGDQSGVLEADVFELTLPAATIAAGRQVEITFGVPRDR
jgi:hypothetical protein